MSRTTSKNQPKVGNALLDADGVIWRSEVLALLLLSGIQSSHMGH